MTKHYSEGKFSESTPIKLAFGRGGIQRHHAPDGTFFRGKAFTMQVHPIDSKMFLSSASNLEWPRLIDVAGKKACFNVAPQQCSRLKGSRFRSIDRRRIDDDHSLPFFTSSSLPSRPFFNIA